MSIHRKISGFLITFAFLLMFVHIAVPHHHHGDMICFSVTCQQECTCHHHHANKDENCNCDCHSHPSHQHDEDNCVLLMPYIVPDNTDFGALLNCDYSSHYQYITFNIPTDVDIPVPAETDKLASFVPDEGLPDSSWDNRFLLRGPPAC